MTKKHILLLAFAFMLSSCYPLGTFHGPGVLPEGEETAGAGVLWLSNVFTNIDTTLEEGTAFLGETSALFRMGLANNSEIGLKIVGLPWGVGSIRGDVKKQLVHEPFLLSVDLGVSYWGYNKDSRYVGLHPALLAGTEKRYAVVQFNHLESTLDIHQTADLILGRHYKMKSNHYILTPLVGIHANVETPDDLYFSVGFGFNGPISDWNSR
jgi:hypothetical protein